MSAVFLFHTSSAAFRAEKALKEAQIAVRLIPTPRQLSSDCGIAVSVEDEHAAAARATLDQQGVEYAAMHPVSP